jgi:hypothetical protein
MSNQGVSYRHSMKDMRHVSNCSVKLDVKRLEVRLSRTWQDNIKIKFKELRL